MLGSLFELGCGKKREFRDAAEDGNLAKVMTMYEEGQDIDSASDYGATALHKASARGQPTMVRFLLSQGADVQAVHKGGRTALQEAELQGNVEVVALLKNAAKDNGRNARANETYVKDGDDEPSLIDGFKEFVVDPGAEAISQVASDTSVVVGDFVTGRKYNMLEVWGTLLRYYNVFTSNSIFSQ
jgi:ankyrin repeat protein